MEVFGPAWTDHSERIFAACREVLTDDDLLVVTGDISWATKLDDARLDLDDIGALPGRKLLLRGNHDYWWQSRAQIEAVLHPSIALLQNDSYVFGDTAIVGGRGWVVPGDDWFRAEDQKVYHRELERLRLSLASLRGKRFSRLVAALHFPPMNRRHEPSQVTALLAKYGVELCVYGHLHGEGITAGFEGVMDGVRYKLVSADSTGFRPWQLDLEQATRS
jgi:hypothetical protein